MMLTGLSGNEIYCLAQKGWVPGNIVVGNSVHSLGFVRSVGSGPIPWAWNLALNRL